MCVCVCEKEFCYLIGHSSLKLTTALAFQVLRHDRNSLACKVRYINLEASIKQMAT